MENLSTLTAKFSDPSDGAIINRVLKGVYDCLRSQILVPCNMVITATSGKKVPKTGAAISYGLVKGRLFSIAAGVDMPALVGTVTNATFNVFCFYANVAGGSLTATSMTSQMGTGGATIDAVKFPPNLEGKAMLGFIIINPTGTGDFVGNTTALDDVTVVPNTVYCSPEAVFDASATY